MEFEIEIKIVKLNLYLSSSDLDKFVIFIFWKIFFKYFLKIGNDVIQSFNYYRLIFCIVIVSKNSWEK